VVRKACLENSSDGPRIREGSRPRDPGFPVLLRCTGANPGNSIGLSYRLTGRDLSGISGLGIAARRSRSSGSVKNPSPVLNHQIELVDQAVDLFEVFPTAFFRFDIQRATERDHVAQIANRVL
jgi:hypothetical protein